MKGAFLLSEDADLFDHVADVLRRRGASYTDGDGGVVQLVDEAGHLLTVFGCVPVEAAWEYQAEPDSIAPGVSAPSPERLTACAVECRIETWFIAVMADLAEALEEPTWVLDANGTLWAAGEID